MKIIIKATNFDLSPSIRVYLEKKIGSLEKFLKRYDPNLVEARVEVGKTTQGQRHGEVFRAEVNLRVKDRLIRVVKTAESLQAAIDAVKDELKEEIRQTKERKLTFLIRRARSWRKFWSIDPLARFRKSK